MEGQNTQILAARAVVGETAARIAQARLLAGVAHGLGAKDTGHAEYAQECLDGFVGSLESAKQAYPDVEWELIVDHAVTHEVHKLHLLFPGTGHGSLFLRCSAETINAIRGVVYMDEKSRASVQ